MTKRKLGIFAAILVGALAIAGPIKVWSTGSTVSAADLNANFAHLHANVGHGHGAILVNADIASSAAISHAKLATPALLPKAVAQVGSVALACTAGTCAQNNAAGLTASVVWTSTGLYTATWSPARPNAQYIVMASSQPVSGADVYCRPQAVSAVGFTVGCLSTAGAAVDTTFNFVVYDNDN